jgi:multicomponent Na+:H+ antiporter subunit B
MSSVILRTATRYMLPLLVLFSVVILLQGHNRPGGGFIGGLIAAAGFSLHAMAYGPASARAILRIDLSVLLGIGLIVALVSGLIGPLLGLPFMTGVWTSVPWPGGEALKIGTPVTFDIGVYIVVLGTVMTMVLALLED